MLENIPPFVFNLMLLAGAIIAGWALNTVILFLVGKWLTNRKLHPPHTILKKHFFPALLLCLCSAFVWMALPSMTFTDSTRNSISQALNILFIVGCTWFAVRALVLVREILFLHFSTNQADNLSQRRMRTQLQYIFRILGIVLFVVGISAVLLSFPGARKVGASLLASAGLASLAIGFAAQKSLGNLIAGFQIAFTQPLRIDDVVIVENEWGRIEEINLTYIVIVLWDLRRLVVPITYFVEKPFQNWTRTSSDIMGDVTWQVDFCLPVEEVRAEMKRIIENEPLWDRKFWNLQVTGCDAKSLALRALVTASDASKLFDLRCAVREKMIAFLRERHPGALPKTRAEIPTLKAVES